MARAQKPDFVFRRNGRVHLNRRGASVQSIAGSRGVRISGSNAGYTMFRGSVKSTDYLPHSPVSPSLPLPCVTVCHHISTGLYQEYFLGVKGGRSLGLTTLPSLCADCIGNLGPSTSWNPQGLSRPVQGLLYMYLCPLQPDVKKKNLSALPRHTVSEWGSPPPPM